MHWHGQLLVAQDSVGLVKVLLLRLRLLLKQLVKLLSNLV
ncbi:UNVERIFIED_CONTAM: hypothetical protein GTU68_054879 [Idotea baltica]|nr:hypothetical protein [Idotea baltica]